MADAKPFTGFPEEGLQFLHDLAANNNRDWFEANREHYQTTLLEPAVAFVAALGEKLQTISGNIHYDTRTNGSGSLMRIYRDTRFSRDKTPYKTNISGMFWEGADKKTEAPAFGFQLQADNMGLMAGIFGFSKEMLQAYRAAVADGQRGAALEQALDSVRNAGEYQIHGEHYKRVPRGYDPDHPRAQLLKYNGLYVHPPVIEAAYLTSADLVDRCFEQFRQMAPVQQWLVGLAA